MRVHKNVQIDLTIVLAAIFLAISVCNANAGFRWVTITGSTTITQSQILTDTADNVYYQTATIKNNLSSNIVGQVRLVVTSSSTTVSNQDGLTTDNKPFKYLSNSDTFSLTPGATSSEVRIEFLKPKKAPSQLFCTLSIENYIDERFLDDDNDGVVNGNDLCPGTVIPTAVDATGCTILDVGVLAGVSRSATGVVANGISQVDSISADGRFVAFESSGNNLIPGDGNGTPDLGGNGPMDCFVKDMLTGAIERVSVSSSGTEGRGSESWGGSKYCRITPDGRYVVFSSDATNLVANDRDRIEDVFLHDRSTKQTIPVSVDSTGAVFGGGNPTITDDGKKVAFIQTINSNSVAYLRDLNAGTSTLISKTISGTQAYIDYKGISISANGKYVVFSSSEQITPDATNGVYQIYRYDTATGQSILISKNSQGQPKGETSQNPTISADGRFVAFESYPYNGSPYAQVYVHDVMTGLTELVSVSDYGTWGGWSVAPSISANGRFIAFHSNFQLSTDVPNYTGARAYVRDRGRGTTRLVSKSSAGVSANNWSGYSVISPNGRFVGFSSNATNLVGDMLSGIHEAYLRDTWGGQASLPEDSAVPSQPQAVTASDITYNSAKISWQPSTDDVFVSSYEISIYNPQTLWLIYKTTEYADKTSTTIPSFLISGIQYRASVTAIDSVGKRSLESSPVLFTTAVPDTAPPTSPTNLVVNFIGLNQISLSWAASTDNYGVAKYDVYKNNSFAASTTATSHSITSLSPCTQYAFHVKALDSANNASSPSQSISVTTFCQESNPPSAPIGLDARPYILHVEQPVNCSIDCTFVELSWFPSTDDQLIQYYETKIDQLGRIDQAITSTYSDQLHTVVGGNNLSCSCKLLPGANYTFSVRAVDIAGNYSVWSNSVSEVALSAYPSIAFTTPADSQPVVGNSVTVRGTVDVDTTDVAVNGISAIVKDGTFVADLVPLLPGTNQLTANSRRRDGRTASATITVNCVSPDTPIILGATPSNGPAPLDVIFTATLSSGLIASQFEWDLDGDGTFEITSQTLGSRTKQYVSLGAKTIRLRVTENNGVMHTASVPVTVDADSVHILRETSISSPGGIDYDSVGNFYIALPNSGAVGVYDRNFNLIKTITIPGVIQTPVDVAVDGSDNIFVLDSTANLIHKITPDGTNSFLGSGIFEQPKSFAFFGMGGFAVSANPDSESGNRIFIIGSNGQLATSFGVELADPQGISAGPDGTLLVADKADGIVAQYSAAGVFVKDIGILAQMSAPSDVGWDQLNLRYLIVDSANSRIVAVDDSEQVLFSLNQASGLSANPMGISVPNTLEPGAIVASSYLQNKVQLISLPSDSPMGTWSAMLQCLQASDTACASNHFLPRVSGRIKANFDNALANNPSAFSSFIAQAANPVPVQVGRDRCRYTYTTTSILSGETVSIENELIFTRDQNGVWKIAR